MSYDLATLTQLVAQQGRIARIVVAQTKGSVPREVGASMYVWQDGQSGTIGGGALEYQAVSRARAALDGDSPRYVSDHPLGPELGQCCGGWVRLVCEVYDAQTLPQITDGLFVRAIENRAPSLAVTRLIAKWRGQGQIGAPQFLDGFMIEPVTTARQPLWIWGAGHVGRALVDVFKNLPDYHITWVDTAANRFPDTIPDAVDIVYASNPADLVPHAPRDAQHLILTYSHAIDFDLCHRLLTHGFAGVGLIGSATKWARFRGRLANLGHSPAQIQRITCPIGRPEFGKHPFAIAIGVANCLLDQKTAATRQKEQTA